MPNFFKKLFSRSTNQPAQLATESPNDQFPEPHPQLNLLMARLFEGHGASVVQNNKWVVVDGGRLMTRAAILRHRKNEQLVSVAMQVLAALPSGEVIEEMFGGFGETDQEAINDACRNFTDGSFHVFTNAFLDRKCDHVDVEEHEIAGVKRRVILGPSCLRGAVPEGEARTAGFIGFMNLLTGSYLPRGTHWIRMYHAEGRDRGVEPITELLLDNRPWAEMQTAVANLNWPRGNEFYSIRNFMVIQDA